MNCVNNDANSFFVNNVLDQEDNYDDVVDVWELRTAAQRLKNGKAVGKDGIPAEVFKYGSVQLLHVISMLFTICLR